MATIFVSAVDGANTDNGTTWALAKQTVAGALAIAANGDVIVVDNAGTFTANAAITWTLGGGVALAIISVTRSGTTSFTPSAGATESVGAANAAFTISGASSSAYYVYGMNINGGTNNNAACNIVPATYQRANFDTCTFDLPTANDRTILIGTTSSVTYTQFLNCTFKRSNATGLTQYLDLAFSSVVEIINPTFVLTGAPTTLIGFNALGVAGYVTMRDGDISAFNTSGGGIVRLTSFGAGSVVIENLKLHATPAITNGSWQIGNASITVRNCDSADTTYIFSYINQFGTLTTDESIYVTSGGAVFDGAGASWKIVTTSACSESTPFILPFIFVWDTTLTAQTASIEIIRDNATALTDRDIWSSLDSAASASFPNYTYQTNRNVNPFTGTPADQPTSTATWTGTGGFANPTKQKLQNTFTAAAAGLLQSRVSIGVASTTFYIDPFIGGVA
jgi:hypothetical protein